MKKFKTEDEALDYALDDMCNSDYEIVTVDGETTILFGSYEPFESMIRIPIEESVESLLENIDNNPNLDDAVNFCGAMATETILNILQTDYKINILWAD